MFHTQAERRRSETAVRQSIENGPRSCTFDLCMFFLGFLWTKSAYRSESGMYVPYRRFLDNILLWHIFSTVGLPARARHITVYQLLTRVRSIQAECCSVYQHIILKNIYCSLSHLHTTAICQMNMSIFKLTRGALKHISPPSQLPDWLHIEYITARPSESL